MKDLADVANQIGREVWEVNNGITSGKARKDFERLGRFVYKPMWGAVAATPKDSPQFSRHELLMQYISAASPKHVLDLLDEIERLRAALIDAEACMSIVALGNTAEYVRILGVVRAALKAAEKKENAQDDLGAACEVPDYVWDSATDTDIDAYAAALKAAEECEVCT